MSDDPKNVQPLHPSPGNLKPRAQQFLGGIENAKHAKAHLERDYVIKGWIDQGAISVVYGEANVGKSFLALDIAHTVQEGISWNGCRVRKGQVLVVAAEGGTAFDNRMVAHEFGGQGAANYWFTKRGINMLGPDGVLLKEAIGHLAEMHGPFTLIIFDTLSRIMGDADENSAPDINALVRRLDHLRLATGAHVMLIHHTGKDRSKGARGHSALRAAIDTEIEITKDEDLMIAAEATKQRDMPVGQKMRYRLRKITLGQDQDGDDVTTCVVEKEQRITQ